MPDHLERVLSLSKHFDSISLGELNTASLMDRVDSKYWFSIEMLPNILCEILDDYLLLNIEGQTFQSYRTSYFDTPDDGFYLDHHNGRRQRVKVRIREYVNSDLRFLEVKQKLNTGKTCKHRQRIEEGLDRIEGEQSRFVSPFIGCEPSSLDIKIQNQFKRMTLVNRNFRERCTIDFNLSFLQGKREAKLDELVVLELKQERRDVPSHLARTLRELRIRPRSFSKYCMGRALLQPELKQNRLKPALSKMRRHLSENSIPSPQLAACF